MRRVTIATVAGAAGYGVLYVVIATAFSARCNGVPIHEFPSIFICWHYVDLWSTSAFLVGLVVGSISPRWSALIASVAVLMGLLVGSIVAPTGWPFGRDHLLSIYNMSLRFVLPAAIGGSLAWFFQRRLRHAPA